MERKGQSMVPLGWYLFCKELWEKPNPDCVLVFSGVWSKYCSLLYPVSLEIASAHLLLFLSFSALWIMWVENLYTLRSLPHEKAKERQGPFVSVSPPIRQRILQIVPKESSACRLLHSTPTVREHCLIAAKFAWSFSQQESFMDLKIPHLLPEFFVIWRQL